MDNRSVEAALTEIARILELRGENTFKVYIENYKQVSSDAPPAGSAWASRDLDEFTLYNIETNKFTGRHTTVTSASTHNRSERLTYDSNCSEHVVKK